MVEEPTFIVEKKNKLTYKNITCFFSFPFIITRNASMLSFSLLRDLNWYTRIFRTPKKLMWSHLPHTHWTSTPLLSALPSQFTQYIDRSPSSLLGTNVLLTLGNRCISYCFFCFQRSTLLACHQCNLWRIFGGGRRLCPVYFRQQVDFLLCNSRNLAACQRYLGVSIPKFIFLFFPYENLWVMDSG